MSRATDADRLPLCTMIGGRNVLAESIVTTFVGMGIFVVLCGIVLSATKAWAWSHRHAYREGWCDLCKNLSCWGVRPQ